MQAVKKCLSTSLLLACMVLASSASAQESRVAKQAMRCTAFFLVLSDSAMVQNFADAFIKELADKGVTISDADMQQRRELVLQELRNSYSSNQAAVVEEAVFCGAWSEGYRLQGDKPTYIPILPKIIPQTVRENYAGLASTAFTKWLSSKPAADK